MSQALHGDAVKLATQYTLLQYVASPPCRSSPTRTALPACAALLFITKERARHSPGTLILQQCIRLNTLSSLLHNRGGRGHTCVHGQVGEQHAHACAASTLPGLWLHTPQPPSNPRCTSSRLPVPHPLTTSPTPHAHSAHTHRRKHIVHACVGPCRAQAKKYRRMCLTTQTTWPRHGVWRVCASSAHKQVLEEAHPD